MMEKKNMQIKDMLFEHKINVLSFILFEKKGVNNTLESWGPFLKEKGISTQDAQKIWDNAKDTVEKQYGKVIYPIVMTIFKRTITSIKGVTKKDIKSLGNAKLDYKVRTKQTVEQALDDKPAPKSSKPLEVKKIKNKISIINSKIREIKLKPNNTPSQILRNKNNINDLKFKKKELQKIISD